MARTPARASARSRYGSVATVLIVLGIVFAALYRFSSGTERHSYSTNPVPPANVQVTAGRTYKLAVPGGVRALRDHGLDPAKLRCQWSAPGTPPRTLDIQLAGADTKATNVIGTFTAPVTGALHVDCTGWGAAFVDDADDASGDPAGLFLVLCVVALGLGVPLGLSWLRGRRQAGARLAAIEDDEVERLVHIVHVRSEDGGPADPGRGDVAP